MRAATRSICVSSSKAIVLKRARNCTNVPVSNQAPLTQFTPEVTFGTKRETAIKPHVAYALVVRDQVGNRILAVVEDNQFSLRIILAEGVPDRLADKAPPIARRHDTTDRL